VSPGDQDAAIARIVKERFEAKRQHALLQSELIAMAQPLKQLAEMLHFIGSPVGADNRQVIALLEQNAEFLLPSKIGGMMKEYAELDRRINELNELARKAGVD
jgi:hypothetical protein